MAAMSGKCPRCEKTVYKNEAHEFSPGGVLYHHGCMRCACGMRLTAATAQVHGQNVMCGVCNAKAQEVHPFGHHMGVREPVPAVIHVPQP